MKKLLEDKMNRITLKCPHQDSLGQVDKLIEVLEEIRDGQKNIISKTQSLKIVRSKLDNLNSEFISVLAWSLSHNHYLERPEFIQDRIKKDLNYHISICKNALKNDFNLSIDVGLFFPNYFAGDIWNIVEPYYLKDDKPKAIEEMALEINIYFQNAYNEAIESINNIYK